MQLYGQFDGWWSHAQVSRGITLGLRSAGIPIEHDNPTARVGFYVGGYPPFAFKPMWRHKVKLGLFIAESEVIPREWVYLIRDFALVVFPSEWTRQAYVRAGVPVERTMVVRHGLHEVYAKLLDNPGTIVPTLQHASDCPRRFLHVAGAVSFLERKGTLPLIEAFQRTFALGQAQLILRSPMTPQLQHMLISVPRELISVHEPETSWAALAPEAMRALYASVDAVIQPSRAEAFGMVPLEARALGLPVYLTACSGHMEHLRSDDHVIASGPSAAITVNGILGGVAPTVTWECIAKALRKVPYWPARDSSYYDRWSWPTVTRPLAERLQEWL